MTVYARPVGDTAPYAVTTYISYNILPANLTAVTLSANPPASQVTGTAITLTATPQGGIAAPNVQYQFVTQYKLIGGAWSPDVLIQDWSTNPQCSWTPLTAENYYVSVYARPVGDTAPYAVTTYITYNILPVNLTGVTLSANLTSPQVTETAITLTATAQGIGVTTGNVQYQFVAQYKLATGAWSPNILIQDWSTNSQCTWTPTTAEDYAVSVYARPVANPAQVVTTFINYNILPANLTAVTLGATPPAPQVTGTPITLTATPQGGITAPNVQYQFVAQYKLASGAWSSNMLIQDWSTNNQCIWTPTTAENYYVNVYARPVGYTAPYAVTTYITYNILPANLTAVTLSANPPTPKPIGTLITLTATALGGIAAPNVEYQFVAQYKLASGVWAPNILISDWSINNQCTWTPTTAEKYYVNVYARPVGDTAPYAVTTYIVYTIQ